MVKQAIEGNSIAETHDNLEAFLLENGSTFMSQRKEVLELLNVHSVITSPFLRGYNQKWHGLMLNSYIDQWFKKNDQGFIYTYGDRMLNYFGLKPAEKLFNGTQKYIREPINQLEFVIKELKENPNSRRAMIIFYNPAIDNGRVDVPCLQTIQYQLRGDILLSTVEYRSHDIDAYYPNICGIAEVSKYVASKLGKDITLGEMNVYSNNLHKYLHCIEDKSFYEKVMEDLY